MASFVYQKGLHQIGASGALDIETENIADNIFLALLTSAYVPDQVNHLNFSDISADEINPSADYTIGGQIHPNSSIEVHRDDPNLSDQIEFQSPVVWTAPASMTASYAVTYYNTGTPSTSPLLFLWDFGGSRVANGRDFVVSWLNNIAHVFGPCPA